MYIKKILQIRISNEVQIHRISYGTVFSIASNQQLGSKIQSLVSLLIVNLEFEEFRGEVISRLVEILKDGA
jgi:hypothetical protein